MDNSLINLDRNAIDREIEQCRTLFKKNGGRCSWGECATCGVIPLLHKLSGAGILEKKEEIEALKKKVFEASVSD